MVLVLVMLGKGGGTCGEWPATGRARRPPETDGSSPESAPSTRASYPRRRTQTAVDRNWHRQLRRGFEDQQLEINSAVLRTKQNNNNNSQTT